MADSATTEKILLLVTTNHVLQALGFGEGSHQKFLTVEQIVMLIILILTIINTVTNYCSNSIYSVLLNVHCFSNISPP